MKPIDSFSYHGISKDNPVQPEGVIHISWVEGALIHIPAESNTRFFELDFEAEYVGDFSMRAL